MAVAGGDHLLLTLRDRSPVSQDHIGTAAQTQVNFTVVALQTIVHKPAHRSEPTRPSTPTATSTSTPTLTSACRQFPGAIFTTDANGKRINQNIYTHKQDVYLQGGPDQQGTRLSDGTYYYRVTDPSGQVSLFPEGYRTVRVSNGAFPLTPLAPFNDTPNPGGEYKVWVSQVTGFDNRCSKTDNFKVIAPTPTLTPTATLTPTVTRAATSTPTPTSTPQPR